jgi:CRP-like cAMP-binding protein
MPVMHSLPLSPMVQKLKQRSKLSSTETDALLALPYRFASLAPGDYLAREGEKAPDHCAVLISGYAHRSKISGNGSRQILSVHMRGDVLDLENSLLEVADHSVQAMTYADVAYIPLQALLDVAGAHPAIDTALRRDALVDASIFREWILNVGQRNARQRVSHLLCEIALRQKDAGICDGPDFIWPMTQEQCGDAAGLTSVHVNRTLQRLKKDGLIAMSRQSVTIADLPRLQQEGDFSRAYLHQGAAACSSCTSSRP